MLSEGRRRQLVQMISEMIASGHSLSAAIEALQDASPRFFAQLRQWRTAEEHGNEDFDTSRLIPDEFKAMLRAGERSGTLREAMGQAATYFGVIYGRSHTAMAIFFYPLGLCLYLKLIVAAVVSKNAIAIGGGLNGALGFVDSGLFLLIVTVLTACVCYWAWWRRRLLAHSNWLLLGIDRLLETIPGLGRQLRRPALAAAAGSLSTTLRAGVALIEALELAAGASRSATLGMALNTVAHRVGQGQELADAVKDLPIDPALKRIFSEAEGDALPRVLRTLSITTLGDAERKSRSLTAVAFFISLVGAAALIGAVIVQVYGGLFNITLKAF